MNAQSDQSESAVCTCVPSANPSVIGACACPIHGMRRLRQLLLHARPLEYNALQREIDEALALAEDRP